MEQAIKQFKAAHEAHVKCGQQVKDIWAEYISLGGCRENRQNLDKKVMKAKKKLLKQRSAAIVRCGNLSQKCNVAEMKMVKAILAS
jgi:hypothetical protein